MGTLPPPRFTTGVLKPDDVDFCYGSRDGQLWKILSVIFNLHLDFETTSRAIEQRKEFLKSRQLGICDIVQSAERLKVDASDLGMTNVKLRDMFFYLEEFPTVDTLLFTGGNSKNGPEYFFRKLLKERGVEFVEISAQVPRIYSFNMGPDYKMRKVKTVSLTAPSGAANRAVGSLEAYKTRKALNPDYTTFDFRVEQYRNYF